MKHALPVLSLVFLVMTVRVAQAAPDWPDGTMRDHMIIRPDQLTRASAAGPHLVQANYAVPTRQVVARTTPVPEPSSLSVLALGSLLLFRLAQTPKNRRGRG